MDYENLFHDKILHRNRFIKTGIKNSQFKIRAILQSKSNNKIKKKRKRGTIILLFGVFHPSI